MKVFPCELVCALCICLFVCSAEWRAVFFFFLLAFNNKMFCIFNEVSVPLSPLIKETLEAKMVLLSLSIMCY